ncbi:MAG TPA: manganese efflux pump [Clostridiales bacterium]|nr:manganese efflux pump [Clostridiales bacterium]
MGTIELLLIAIGLSMDAFAVAVCKGLSVRKPALKHFIIVGLYFGIFQAVMPLIGYLIGSAFASLITSIDHWVVFVLLSIIGAHMIWESRKHSESGSEGASCFTFSSMIILALATSIDALAIGIAFASLKVNIVPAVLLIGVTTFAFSCLGVKIGNVFGEKYKTTAEFAGGVILILLGVKILIEHLVY